MNNALKENGQTRAASLVQHSRNTQFYGFNQLIRTDSNGLGISEYIILDTNWKEWGLYSTYSVDMEMEVLWFGRTPSTSLEAGPLEQMQNAGLQKAKSAE